MQNRYFLLKALALCQVFCGANAGHRVQAQGSGACVEPAPGLVGWWTGDDIAADRLKLHDGETSAEMAYVTGKVGNAFNFNDANQFVKTPANSKMEAGTGFTIELWIYPVATTEYPIAEWSDDRGKAGVHLLVWEGVHAGKLFMNIVSKDGKDHTIASGPGIIKTSVFQHVAAAYDKTSGIARLYRNGVLMAESNLGEFQPEMSRDLWLGHRPTKNYHFKGALDEVSIYNRALTASEIQTVYEAGAAGKCAPAK